MRTVALLAIVAAAPAAAADPARSHAVQDRADALAHHVRDAIAHRDARALVLQLSAPLRFAGLPGKPPSCADFAWNGTVEHAEGLAALAACLVDAAHGLDVRGHVIDPATPKLHLPRHTLNVLVTPDSDRAVVVILTPA